MCLDGVVRLMESVGGYEKFSDEVIKKVLYDLKTRKQMRQVIASVPYRVMSNQHELCRKKSHLNQIQVLCCVEVDRLLIIHVELTTDCPYMRYFHHHVPLHR